MSSEVRREADRRRREQIRTNGPRESFSLAEIGERDLWRCGICLDPVNRQFHMPDPRAPSMDHIKALSLGGTHTRDNVRVTHLFCNMDRNYAAKPGLSPVRVVRDPSGGIRVVVGDVAAEDIPGEIVLDRRMCYPRTPEEARRRLARRVERVNSSDR